MRRFIQNEDGNLGIIFVLTAGIIMSAIGMAVDMNSVQRTSNDLQSVVDSAALAGALRAEGSKEARLKAVEDAIVENTFGHYPDILDQVEITFDDDAKTVSVRVVHDQKLMFGSFLGRDTMEVSPISQVSYATDDLIPLTIVFALDVSGSMTSTAGSGQPKIDVLKDAVTILFEELEANTRNPALLDNSLRTGMSAYNTSLVSTQPVDWGFSHLDAPVGALIADGGTNSTPSLQGSYDRLLDDRSFRQAHSSKFKVKDLREYVLFMTDGDNNEIIYDEDSRQLCETMRSEGIEIYSVAFSAPTKGELLLLDCASWDEDKGLPKFDRGDESNADKCGNDESQPQPVGYCLNRVMADEKVEYYFNADNAAEFRAAFARIGREISPSNVRLVGR